MAARKTTKKVAAKKKTTARPKSKVLLFRLGDVAAARQVLPAFDLPPAYLDLAFYALDRQHKQRVTLFDILPEPEVPEDLAARALALAEAIVNLLSEGTGCPIDLDSFSIGYHAGATHAQVVERFLADGFEIISVDDLVRDASRPRDIEASKATLARAERAMGKGADALALGSVVIDEAIETWSEIEERAFQRAAEARALGGFVASEGGEPVGVDRWGMLAARLARAGFTPEEIEDVWLDGVADAWPSATWFAMSLLPRLDAIAHRILDRADRREPTRPLERLLVDPIEELPSGLDSLYQAGVARLLAESDVGSALNAASWERLVDIDKKAFARLAPQVKRAPLLTTAPALLTPAPRLADVKARYGVDFPEEMLAIWDIACSLSPRSPRDAFGDDDLLGITLVGPFDLLAGRTRVKKGLDVRLHWRYRFDPPELFTVAAGNEDGLHFGYWFDDPAAGAACVASYYAHDAYEIDVPGRTLGEALRRYIERDHEAAIENLTADRAYEAAYQRDLGRLARLRTKLQTVATGDRPELGAAYLARYDLGTLRARTALLATPDCMGVVAPPDRYQPLSLAMEAIPPALSKPRSRRALVAEALDLAARGAPAAALMLGKICWAQSLDEEAYALLDAAYAGLDRPALREVLALHRAHRDLATVDVLTR